MFKLIVEIVIAIGILAGIVALAAFLFLRQDDQALMQSDEEYDDENPEIPEPAVEVTWSRLNWREIQEYGRMRLRAERPHLYALDWYEIARRDLSLWSVEQAEIQATWYHEEMGMPYAA